MHAQLTDGRDRAGRLYREDPLRGAGQRVAAGAHRHRAGVPGSADERDLGVALAGDRGDHAERLATPFELRPLLDVHLGVAHRRLAGDRWLGDEVGEGDAIVVDACEPCGVEAPGHRRRAEVRGAEAHALLVREAHDLDGERQRLAQPLEHLDRDDDPERPVVAPGVADRVQVGAQYERAALAEAADQIADLVLPHRQAGLSHPGCDERVRLAHRVRAEAPRESAALLADLAEPRAPLEHPRRAAQLPR